MANRRPKKGAKRGRASSRSAPTPARRQEAVKPKIPTIEARVRETQWSESFSGPLPPPAMLADYERVMPGMAERILRTVEKPIEMAHDQQVHRHQLENKVITSDIRRSWAGMVIGASLSMAAIVGGVLLVLNDKPAEGLASILAALGTLVAAFLRANKRRADDLEKSRPNR